MCRLAAVALALTARGVGAQGTVIERLGLDRLRLTTLGIAVGPVAPARVVATESYAIQADYGEIARHWHVVLAVSYWGSRFTDRAVDQLVKQLRRSIVDPAADDTIKPGRVRVSDIALEADLRWVPRTAHVLVPYVGAGVGAHVVNAESKLIDNTFVESALDNIGTGISGTVGLDVVPGGPVRIGIEARYTMLSDVRFGTVRATGSYRFRPRRAPR